MNASVATAMNILEYNSWLFGSAVKDVPPNGNEFRVNDKTNQFDRIAGHIAVSRHGLATLLQLDVPNLNWGDFAKGGERGQQFNPEVKCPSLDEIAAGFNDVTKSMMSKLPNISNETLATASPFPIPGDNPTLADLLAFLTMHESYHIGQLGLLKKSMTGRRIMDG